MIVPAGPELFSPGELPAPLGAEPPEATGPAENPAVPGAAVPGDPVPGGAAANGGPAGETLPGGTLPGGMLTASPLPGAGTPGGPLPGDVVWPGLGEAGPPRLQPQPQPPAADGTVPADPLPGGDAIARDPGRPTLREAADARVAPPPGEPGVAPPPPALRPAAAAPVPLPAARQELLPEQGLRAVPASASGHRAALAHELVTPPASSAQPMPPAPSAQSANPLAAAAQSTPPGQPAPAAAQPQPGSAARVDALPVYAPFAPQLAPRRTGARDDEEERVPRAPHGASARAAREARVLAAAARAGLRLRRAASPVYDFIDERGAFWALLAPLDAGLADAQRALAHLSTAACVLVDASALDPAAAARLARQAESRGDARVVVVDAR